MTTYKPTVIRNKEDVVAQMKPFVKYILNLVKTNYDKVYSKASSTDFKDSDQYNRSAVKILTVAGDYDGPDMYDILTEVFNEVDSFEYPAQINCLWLDGVDVEWDRSMLSAAFNFTVMELKTGSPQGSDKWEVFVDLVELTRIYAMIHVMRGVVNYRLESTTQQIIVPNIVGNLYEAMNSGSSRYVTEEVLQNFQNMFSSIVFARGRHVDTIIIDKSMITINII